MNNKLEFWVYYFFFFFSSNKVKTKLFFADLFWISLKYFDRGRLLKHLLKTFPVGLEINVIPLKVQAHYLLCLLVVLVPHKADFYNHQHDAI